MNCKIELCTHKIVAVAAINDENLVDILDINPCLMKSTFEEAVACVNMR